MALVETAVEVILGAQTEITIFLLAIIAHWIFFGKHAVGIRAKPPKKAPSLPPGAGGGGGAPKNSAGSPKSPKTPGTSPGAAPVALVRAVQGLVAGRAAEQEITDELKKHLGRMAHDQRSDALAALLATCGRSAPASREFVAAVRAAPEALGFAPGASLFEALLRCCLAMKSKTLFNEVLKEAEAAHGSNVSGIVALVMRAAVQAGDLDTALARMPALAPAWKAPTPSVAQGQLFQRLARLAAERKEIPRLLSGLQGCSLVLPWTVEAVLSESGSAGDEAGVACVTELAACEKVELTSGAHAALIRRADDTSSATKAVEVAFAAGCQGKEVFLAAFHAATHFRSACPALPALAKLPASVPSAVAPEVAAALVHLHAPGGLLAGEDSDAALLGLFSKHLVGADFAADPRAEWLLADAALRKGDGAALGELLAAFGDNARCVVIMKSLANLKRLEDCNTVFRACAKKNACLYNALIDACIDCGESKAAEKIMAEASDAKLADVVTYNTMIKAHLRRGNVVRARKAMAAMREVGLLPNCVTFNELLDAATGDRPEALWALVDEMKASGCKPNHVTCSIVLKSVSRASRAGDVEKALAVVEAMEDDMDEVLLSSVCEACIRSGRHDILRTQLQRQTGARSVQIKGAHTFGSLIRAYGVLHDTDGVWNAWLEMKRRSILPTSVTLGCVIEALAANGQVDEAYELIREQMEDSQVRPMMNAVIYCSVLKGFSHRKRFDRVWSVYEEMKKEKLQFSVVTYNTLVDACARSSDMGRIPGLLEEMAAQSIEPNVITYSAIVKGYCQENRLDRAFELLEDMKKMKGFCPDEVTYNTLVDGCARYGMWDKGMEVLAEMEAVGVNPSAFTLSVLVKLANRSRRSEKGFELVETLCKKYRIRLTVHVYNNLVHAANLQNDLPKAFEVVERMLREKVRPDERSYALLLRGAVSARSAEDITGILRAAAGLRGAHPRLAAAASGSGALRPTSAVSEAVTSEALEGLAAICGDESLALQLASDLRRPSGGRGPAPVAVDPRLHVRLTSKATASAVACQRSGSGRGAAEQQQRWR